VPGRLWPRADLRAGDDDRQTVVAELQRHFIDGRLTSDELGERVDLALNARTFGDLANLLTDLPVLSATALAVDSEHVEVDPDTSHFGFGPPLGAMLVLIGVVSILWMFAIPGGHIGGFGFWPILIWGFFFIGRPPRRGRRNRWHGGGPPARHQ
jgi:Domain of unknown function (DUF1707)